MKIPFGFSDSLKPSGLRPRILIHGDLIHTWAGNWTVRHISTDALQFIQSATPRPVLFLAAPFVHSFVHETIQLSKDELRKADKRLLGFENYPPPQLTITTIRLNDKKALTIHSHLTDKGAGLLKDISRKKNPVWYPAVLSLICNIHQRPDLFSESAVNIRVFLAQEALQFDTRTGPFRCLHLNYLQTDQAIESRRQTTELILERENRRQSYTKLFFSDNDFPDLHSSINSSELLLTPPPKNREIRSISRIQKNRRFSFRIMLRRNIALGFATLIIVLWAVALRIHVEEINRERLQMKQQVAELREKSLRFGQIADVERKYIMISAIGKTVRQLQLRPVHDLENLKPLLPGGVWLQRAVLDRNHIKLTLLDSGEIEVSKLIERLGDQYGKTSLITNEEIMLNKTPARRYQVEVTTPLPDK